MTKGTIYVLGAGFSRTCGIATDYEMLSALNPLLKRTLNKDGTRNTYIEAIREQNFSRQKSIGFENFMSAISALKYLPEFLGPGKNVFQDAEREIRAALRTYLRSAVATIAWDSSRSGGKSILDFVKRVDWTRDAILTFNYDLLLETALKKVRVSSNPTILHLHGAIGERILAWPTYKKLAYRNTRTQLAIRWKTAFKLLRDRARLKEIVFIGYSMPPTDLEAKGLFNYADWYNCGDSKLAATGRLLSRVPPNEHYGYKITVVNPGVVTRNYSFFRKRINFKKATLADWL